MEFVRRLASPDVALSYPLDIDGSAPWSRDKSTDGQATWQQEISLPVIPAGHIIVPSFALRESSSGDYAFNFSLHTETTRFDLQPVPVQQSAQAVAANPPNAAVSCHIDCWHTEQTLSAAKIRLSLTSVKKPTCYLLTVSVRALQNIVAVDFTEARSMTSEILISVPASISQMQAAKEIRASICSPTALAMALSVFDNAPSWDDTVQACYDPQSGGYGAWPLAIQWASRHGIMGAVEALTNWRDAIKILRCGVPMVCSIRFAKGKLHGAPLTQTGGHLVMLHGLSGDHVQVKDPAAKNDKQVDRRYRLDEFSEAWLQRRGAAYIFCGDLMQNQQAAE